MSPRHSLARRHGATVVLLLIALVVIIGMAAFSVEVGRMLLLRTEIQHAVDSGAMAAGLSLGDDPEDIDAAVAAAESFVQQNSVGSYMVTVPEEAITVEVGTWDAETRSFSATTSDPDAVRVSGRQDNEPFLFGRIFGRTTFSAPASAVASSNGKMLDIMMTLDLSGSMGGQGRIQALWNAAPTFVDIIEDIGGEDKIGMMGLCANPNAYDPEDEGHNGVLYSSGLHPDADHRVGVLESDLTLDYDHLRDSVLISANMPAGKYAGWTGTGAALGDSVHYLLNSSHARLDSEKFVVIMSDGHANKPPGNGPGYARTMAQYAADNNITVHTISLGNSADVDLMEDIATTAGGQHFDATGSGEEELTEALTQAFQDIAAAIKRTVLVQ